MATGNIKARPPPLPKIGKAFELMELYFRTAVFINAVPFQYDKQRRIFVHDTRTFKFKIWAVLMLVVIVIETAQTTYELIRAKADPEVGRGDWALVYFVFVSWIFVSTCHYNVLKNGHLIVNHLNQTVRMREWFQVHDKLPQSKDHKLVKAHIWSSCSQCFFQCLMVAAEGYKGHYVYSNLPLEYRGVLSAVLWAIWAYYRVMTNFLCGYLHYFAGVLTVQTCNQVLALRSTGAVNLVKKLKYFRMVQLLCERYSEGHTGIFIPSITLFAAQNLILGIYGIVKLYDKMVFDLYANFPLMVAMMMLFVCTFYPKNATLYESTKDEYISTLKISFEMDEEVPTSTPSSIVQRSFSNRLLPNAKEVKCIAMSCPVIGINLGGLYVIKRSTVLNIFNFILCNTISTLITYP